MVLGVPSAYGVAVLMVFVGLLAIMVPLGMLIRELAFSQALPILRDARTRRRRRGAGDGLVKTILQ